MLPVGTVHHMTHSSTDPAVPTLEEESPLEDGPTVDETGEAPVEEAPRQFSIKRVLVLVMVGIVLVLFNAAFASSAYYRITPGPAPEVTEMVTGQIADPEFGQHGKIHFTTVKVEESPWWEYIWRHIVPTEGVSFVPRSSLGSGDQSQQSVVAAAQMNESKEIAYVVASQYSGTGSGEGQGAQIRAVIPGGAAERSGLTLGEVIVAVDGTPVKTAEEAADLIAQDDTALLDLRRGETTRQVEATLDSMDGRWVLGLQLGTEVLVEGDQTLSITTEGIGGPSAGLMFTIALTDALSEGDLTNDRDLAGTGTIALDGTVGPISGIEDKVLGARAVGAEVFFAPAVQADAAAEAAPEGLEVVSVATFEDALLWLCNNGGTASACPR